MKGEEGFLVWDKDDEASMDFVTACSNLRSHVFSIPRKSRFDVKGIIFFFLNIWIVNNKTIARNFYSMFQQWQATLFQVAIQIHWLVKLVTPLNFPLAIASTNAVIAGLIVFEAFKILEDKWEECRHVIKSVQKTTILRFPNHLIHS